MNEATQVTFLSALVHLESRLRDAETVDVLSYRLANETRNLIQYDQMIVWRYGKNGINLSAVSGVDRVAVFTPFSQQFQSFISSLRAADKGGEMSVLSREDFLSCPGGDLLTDLPWNHLLWVPLSTSSTSPCAGLLVFREKSPWNEQERKLFQHLSQTAHHAWKALAPRFEKVPRQRRWIGASVAGVLLLMSCFPVRLSVLAPAEVVAKDMVIVTSPLNGIISEIHVCPNQTVAKGQHLITLEQTTLANQLNVSRQAYEVVKAQYQHARQRAFSDPEARENILLLEAQLQQKQAEQDYAATMLEQTHIVAPRDGVVVFNDANDWLGRPVETGERIMMVASPKTVEVRILLPVDNVIRFAWDEPTSFFLNVAPTRPLSARIEMIGYESVTDPQLGPVYPVKAALLSAANDETRIGARGTARLYGNKVPLMYAILRKPLTLLRLYIGV